MKSDDVTVNGVRVGGPDTKVDESDIRTIELPSGARAEVRKGYGRDLMRAQRAAVGADASAVIFALIAEITRVNGRKIVYEDVLEMDLADVMELQADVIGENFDRPPQRASQALFNPDSQSKS
jgi:hypothetical protein